MKQSHTGPNNTTPLSPHVPTPTGQYTTESFRTMCRVHLVLTLTGTCLLTGVGTVKMLHWAWTVK